MKNTLKIIALLLLLMTALSLFVGCKKQEENDESENTEELSVLIGEGGESLYKLVRPQKMPKDYLTACTDFFKTICKDSKFSLKFGDDYTKKDADKSAPLEILFGATDRDETRAVYDEINYDGYAVKSVGNKIVIAAYTKEKLREASSRFFSECIKIEDDGQKLTFVKNVVEKGSEEKFFTPENKLEDYKIVYGYSNLNAAKALATEIRKYSGIELPVVSYRDGSQEKEILVGETGREESKSTLPETNLGFVFKAVGTKLVINAEETSYVDAAITQIKDKFIVNAPSMNFAKSTVIDTVAYAGPESTALTEGADIRIMSFNILCELWDKNATMEPRILGVVGTISAYQPDVIGIQEVSPKWYSVIRKYLGEDYEFINSNKPSGTDQNYTALAYNKNKVKLIANDYKIYSVYNSTRLRSINFGLFEHIATGKQFGVTNTHFNANHKTAAEENINRNTQATELVAKIKEYTDKYNCPIFMCGDYNSKDETAAYKTIVADGTIKEAKNTAKTKGKICLTYHGLGTNPASGSSSIDHIFHTGKTTALYYTTLVDDILVKSSDHCPIFADFTLD